MCEVVAYFNFLLLPPGQDNFCLIHVSLIPVLGVVGEQVINSFCLSGKPIPDVQYLFFYIFIVLFEAKIDGIFLKFIQLLIIILFPCSLFCFKELNLSFLLLSEN